MPANNRSDTKVQSTLRQLSPRSAKHLAESLQQLIKSRLWLQIIVAMVLGIGVGILLGPDLELIGRQTAATIGEWLALPGYFFLAMVQMIVVPLVFASVIRGIASNQDIEQLRTTGIWLVVYFLGTTVLAILLGLTLGKWIQPGTYIDSSLLATPPAAVEATDVPDAGFSLQALPRQVIDVLPANPLAAMADAQMLQVVLFAFVVGLALLSMVPRSAKPLLDLLGSIESVTMTIVRWVMTIAPYAVFGLMARVTITTGLEVLSGVAVYVATVIAGLILLLVLFLVLAAVLGRANPFKVFGHIREVLLMAFSTGSSAAVMPLSIKTAEEKLGVRPSTAQFVIPIGATVNMAGSAMYQGLATIFLTQVYGLELNTPQVVALIVTIVGASIGTPATPGVGIVVLSTVLTAAGVPLEGISLIMGVDRVLEMMRTSLNVTGDLVGTIIMDRMIPTRTSKEEELQKEAENETARQASGEDVLVAEVS